MNLLGLLREQTQQVRKSQVLNDTVLQMGNTSQCRRVALQVDLMQLNSEVNPVLKTRDPPLTHTNIDRSLKQQVKTIPYDLQSVKHETVSAFKTLA